MRAPIAIGKHQYEFPHISAGQSIMLSYFLLSVAWLNFVVKVFYGLPFFGTPEIAFEYYEPIGNNLSLAEIFLYLSLASSFVCLCVVWITSFVGRCKWRQRLLVLMSGCIVSWLSMFYSKLEPFHIQDAKYFVESLKEGRLTETILPEDSGHLIRRLELNIQRAEARQK